MTREGTECKKEKNSPNVSVKFSIIDFFLSVLSQWNFTHKNIFFLQFSSLILNTVNCTIWLVNARLIDLQFNQEVTLKHSLRNSQFSKNSPHEIHQNLYTNIFFLVLVTSFSEFPSVPIKVQHRNEMEMKLTRIESRMKFFQYGKFLFWKAACSLSCTCFVRNMKKSILCCCLLQQQLTWMNNNKQPFFHLLAIVEGKRTFSCWMKIVKLCIQLQAGYSELS